MKRNWTVIVGSHRFTMILMNESEDALSVVRSIWPEGTVE